MTFSAVVYALAGVSALLAALLPRLLRERPLSLPMAFLGLGMAVGALPGIPEVDPLQHGDLVEHAAGVVVIIALMGAGIAIDRPFSWKGWLSARRLILLAMPATIVLVAASAWWLAGLPIAAALLVGAVLAPTDPVLASDVQVGRPSGDEEAEEDEVRFSLTSEAGLNDGAAFPAVHLALVVAAAGAGWATLGGWAVEDLLLRTLIGLAVGLAIGWVLARTFHHSPVKSLRLAEEAEGFTALAVTFLAYGVAEILHGYGFVAVFVAAVTIRNYERTHDAHETAHGFMEQIERMLTAWLLLLLGAAISDGLFAHLTWGLAAVGILLILVFRPLVGWVSLLGTNVRSWERFNVAFFGVRGIGSLYYVAYALNHGEFPGEALWAVVGFTVTLSVVLHGVLSTPAVRRLDRSRKRRKQKAQGAESVPDGTRHSEGTDQEEDRRTR